MQAFILAGGLGTRLRPIVSDRPKGLASVAGAAFLEHQVKFLRRSGVTEVVLCVGYLHDQIEQYFGTGDRCGLTIHYSVEQEPLGTAGALKNAEALIRGTFLLLNGDTHFDIDLEQLVQAHGRTVSQTPQCAGTLVLTAVSDPRAYGSVALGPDGFINEFVEKQQSKPAGRYVSAGIYVLEPSVLTLIPPSRPVSLERDTFPAILASGRLLAGHPVRGLFVDIGTPDGYYRLNKHLEDLHPCS